MLKSSHTHSQGPCVASHPVHSITQTHRLRPKPIFLTRFNTLDIFYVRIILMMLRCVSAVVWWHRIFFFPIFAASRCLYTPLSLASPDTFYVLDSWHPGGGHLVTGHCSLVRAHFRTFLARLRGDCRGWAWPSSTDQRKVKLISFYCSN